MAISARNEKWNVIYFFKLDDHYFLFPILSFLSILYYTSTIYIYIYLIVEYHCKFSYKIQAYANLTFIKRQDYLMDQTFPHFH